MAHPILRIARLKYGDGSVEQKHTRCVGPTRFAPLMLFGESTSVQKIHSSSLDLYAIVDQDFEK
jgi:hypothetical protein